MSMLVLKEIGEVIAERSLYLEGQPATKIRVLLGRPQERPAASDEGLSLCPYQILGIGDEKVRFAGGTDSVQALQLAMEMIGSELYFKINRRHNHKLRWEGGKAGDLGFPVPHGLEQEIGDGSPG
ncbi:MAG TPA: hypothetical protein VN911_21265 [Candidatus Acidoferrum sp.]|nr:hypothetical protein [Candidatus Acidoferrum sp.]